MERLREKTFYTIFFIISLFIVSAVLVFNIQSYQKEYSGITNNLKRMNTLVNSSPGLNEVKPENNRDLPEVNLNNRIIMDYNFYTIILDKNNNVIDKISHNENEFSDEIMNKAMKIISNNDGSEIKVSCLYFSKIAYNLNLGNFLIIVDTSNVQYRLVMILIGSVTLLGLFEGLVYYWAKKITDWITKPVEDSFNKQKEFIANASHELKTPLAVMMASIDCLEVGVENEKWVNNLKSESERMNNLITRLLDLSRLENGWKKEVYTLNNLSKIVEKRTLVFESLAFENKVEIVSEIEKGIMFRCSPSDMDELVGVILDNAIKHSFRNSKIKVGLYKEGGNIILDIVNNGEEIGEEDREKIFERFYRSDKSRNRKSNRYGLGLAIAKNIVMNHGGEIKVFSADGYTTFRVIFKDREH